MRILLVTNYQPPHMGGIEFAAQSLKACWERDGHTVTWLSTDIPRGGRPSTPDNVRVPAANFAERWWQINSPLVSPFAYPRILALIRSHDVVNVHSLAPGLSNLVMKAALRRRRPVVITQHVGIIPLGRAWLSRLQKTFVCATARWAAARGAPITFVGAAVRQWFLDEAGLRPDQVHMTPAGIDQHTYHFVGDQERAALRLKWQTAGPGLHVLFVGRFYDKKGLPLIREVAAANPSIRFTLVGSGPHDPTIWGLPNVRVIGYVSTEELRELYGSHDLFLMPSFGEGWPAVVPQAMACGLPCLISPECFSGYGQDEDRFLVCARESGALQALLQSAAAGRLPLLEQRRALSDYACRVWDWQRTARIYLALFERTRQTKPA